MKTAFVSSVVASAAAQQLGSNRATWSPYGLTSTSSVRSSLLDAKPAATWSPSAGTKPAPLGSDPATWSPSAGTKPAPLGSDPATWTPNMDAYTACLNAGRTIQTGSSVSIDPACMAEYEKTGSVYAPFGSDPATWSPSAGTKPAPLGSNPATWSPEPAVQALPPNMDAYTACKNAGRTIQTGSSVSIDPACMAEYEAAQSARPCCRAITAECLACSAKRSKADYCAEFPFFPDCLLGSDPATWSPTPVVLPAEEASAVVVSQEYNCNTREVWTNEKSQYCCANEGKGCMYAVLTPREAPVARGTRGDAQCAGGILSDDEATCCPAMCGTCGGKGCGLRPGGFNSCCRQNILAKNMLCTVTSAPCVMVGAGYFDPTVEVSDGGRHKSAAKPALYSRAGPGN